MTSNNKNNNPKESLEKSIKEMKLMREGEMEKVTWEKFKGSLRNDN